MKSCENYQEDLPFLLEEVLEAPERADLQAHLAVCPTCSSELSAYQGLRSQMLSDTPSDPGDLFFQRQLKAIEAQIRLAMPRQRSVWIPALAAAAMLLLVFGLGRWREQRDLNFKQDWNSALHALSLEPEVPMGDVELDDLNEKELALFAHRMEEEVLGSQDETWFDDDTDWDDLDDGQENQILQQLQDGPTGRQT